MDLKEKENNLASSLKLSLSISKALALRGVGIIVMPHYNVTKDFLSSEPKEIHQFISDLNESLTEQIKGFFFFFVSSGLQSAAGMEVGLEDVKRLVHSPSPPKKK